MVLSLRCAYIISFILAVTVAPTEGLDNGLGRTPPLGWSSWNYFANHINETVFEEMADAMVSTGLAKIGYTYINVDAGYLTKQRDVNGKLVVDKTKFPSGMRHLSDYIHAKGLKLGVYTDLTAHSCGTGPGSYEHYDIDADTFANDWQADYLKVDYCGGTPSREPAPQYAAFDALGLALNKTGRNIYYSICPHTNTPASGTGLPYRGASIYSPPQVWNSSQRQNLANSLLVEYVNSFDLWYADPIPAGDGGAMAMPGGMITNIDSMVQMTDLKYSLPGSWNDADMLQICTYGEGATRHWNSTGLPGNTHGTGMTLTEYESHISVWAIMASPLILSADLRTVAARHPDCLKLMLNPEIVAVNQDAGGFSPKLVAAETNVTGSSYLQVNSTAIIGQTWMRPLLGGRVAVVLFNRADSARVMSVTWEALGLKATQEMKVRDVVKRIDLPTWLTSMYAATVQAHGISFVVLTPTTTTITNTN
eukprot:m.172584 g.172584  ORF g.172584 m.172584 type:complete len:478 (+) comp31695_c1_seq1:172-1605(+)